MVPVEERVWRFIECNNGCWRWTGATHPTGYGLLGRGGRSAGLVRATHVIWKIVHGEYPPKGLYICHTCDNPPCCNPEHLFLGTPTDNFLDMRAKNRDNLYHPHYEFDNGKTKIADADVVELRRIWGESAPPRRHGRIAFREMLGERFGISPKYVGQLVSEGISSRNLRKR